MDYPIHIDTISMELSILYFKKLSVKLFLNDVFLFPKIVFNFANSADPDEMPTYAAYHLGLHCLPKYLFTGIQNEKGYDITDILVNNTLTQLILFISAD